MQCHELLDPLWKDGGMSRRKVYAKAARIMGLEVFHIGQLDEDQCHKLINHLMTMEI